METTERKLTAERVYKVIRDCLFRNSEIQRWVNPKVPEGAVVIEGIVQKFGFHKERLESHREEVREMLNELPDQFFVEKGGWSFLNACNDKTGYQWGEHSDMEALFSLGIGLGFVKYAIEDRQVWQVFPGGVPYIIVDLKK